jgi:4-hydroxy-4-methyl-2-oxoglutarate aldolase
MDTEERIAAFRELGSSFVADAMQKLGLPRRIVTPNLRPLLPDRPLAGTAVTFLIEYRPVEQPPLARKLAQAFRQGQDVPSPVLVTESRLGARSPYGGGAARSFVHAGIAGVIIDGAIRDLADVRAQGFQMFHRDVSPDSFAVPRLPEGYIGADAGVPVRIGGVTATSGDMVVADEDGIVFCRAEDAPAVIATARGILAEEEAIFARWATGQGYLEGLGLSPDQ